MIRDVRRKISASLKPCYVAHNLHRLTNHSIQMMNKPLCMQINNEDSGAYSFFFFSSLLLCVLYANPSYPTAAILYVYLCCIGWLLYRTPNAIILLFKHITLWEINIHMYSTHRYGIEMTYIRKYAVLSGTVANGGGGVRDEL